MLLWEVEAEGLWGLAALLPVLLDEVEGRREGRWAGLEACREARAAVDSDRRRSRSDTYKAGAGKACRRHRG